jgi:hypothetical protein
MPSKDNLFSKIGTVLAHTATGLTNPSALTQMNKQAAAEQEILLERQRTEQFRTMIMADIMQRRMDAQQVVNPGIQAPQEPQKPTSVTPITPSVKPGQIGSGFTPEQVSTVGFDSLEGAIEDQAKKTRELQQKQLEIPIKVQEQEALIEPTVETDLRKKIGKENLDREANFRSAMAGIDLTTRGFGDAIAQGNEFVKSLGINIDPSRGLQGKGFAILNQISSALGYNPLYNAFEKGMAIELAPELAKAQGGGIRLGKMIIDAFRKTVPTLKGTTAEGAEQLALTAANIFRKEAAKERDKEGNFIYGSAEEVEKAMIDFQTEIKDKIYKSLIVVGAYTPEMKKIIHKGESYTVPDYLVPDFKRKMQVGLGGE